ncbi:pilus assembly protein [Shewanella youngdeokensis]|uniref:PilC/PilY family type IV pilus protein n=1 Tax=Shewanella youngdeokensis TaxID=2999068 RepID=A0ABZ0JVF5_9GAMM|nr:PilC/PilY family type IV pilus protein [Shewanella sp. DAU334]
MNIKRFIIAMASALVMMSGFSHGDDTELYVFESSSRSGDRPQVLIIFDNSGSMDTWEYTEELYDRGESLKSSTKLYYAKGGGAVPEPSSTNFFKNKVNGCKASKEYLKGYGFFTGSVREYKFIGDNGTWSELPDTLGGTLTLVDCFEDFSNEDDLRFQNTNDYYPGFPVDSLGSPDSPEPYTYAKENTSSAEDIQAAIDSAYLTDFGTGESVTVYTENYVNWYHSNKSKTWMTRMAIAQRVIEDTVVTTPSVDFGLAVFNINSREGSEGGRVISGIKRLQSSEKTDFIEMVNGLDAETNTPLCETLYEAYRYFSGGKVYFAKTARNISPDRDTDIESGSSYDSPFESSQCSNRAYVVYITDGSPTADDDANKLVKAMDGYKSSEVVDSSYLPALASIMYRKDVNPSLEGDQFVSTYTIGFSDGADDAAPILSKTAELSGAEYFAAKDATQLQAALQDVFAQILEVNSSFTSPSVATNNFDRTQTFDSVYYSMFLPNKGPRWQGNLKKFKVNSDGEIIDKNGASAIGDDDNLSDSACSYWTPNSVCSASSGGGDGNNVGTGGVLHELRTGASRTLYGDFGSNGALAEFSKSMASSRAGGDTNLASYMGVSKSSLSTYFDWAKGKDTDDEDGDSSTSDPRDDIFGDPLHSKPLAINFGTADAQDVRVLVGTNHGFLHMFKDEGDSVSESWAFMPYELLPNLPELKANVPTGVHSVYGLDSPPISYVKTATSGAIEKAWVFVGMRRGGKSYYALDITNPDKPKFMWKIDSNSSGMGELGQSWAEPVVTYIPGWPAGNTDIASAKPVLIFGGGYSPATKDSSAIGIADTQGRAVFIVDAESGKLIHSFGPTSSATMTALPGIADSIPNSVAVLDSNGDKLTDRIYATDTGANVWRMDLPSTSPSDSTAPWTAFKFAELGNSSLESDRRFFAEAAVAQTTFTNVSEVSVTVGDKTTTSITYQSVPYDAVVVGTGNRPHPLGVLRSDKFFALQDRNVVSKSFNGIGDNTVPAVISMNSLYNVSSKAPSTEAENVTFSTKRGWYYDYVTEGEKSLSAATIIQGRVFFSTYVPGDEVADNQCLVSGGSRLYGFDLHRGTRAFTKEYIEMGDSIPDTPQLVIPPDGDNMYLIGIGNAGDDIEFKECAEGSVDCPAAPECGSGNSQCVGGGLEVNKIYYHVND